MKRKNVLLTTVIFVILLLSLTVVCSVAESEKPTLKLTGANVLFVDGVDMLFAVDTENVPDTSRVELLVFRGDSVNLESCIKGNESASLKTNGRTVSEGTVKGIVFEYDGVEASEMTENIYLRAYYTDGKAHYSPVVKYSVIRYACNKLGVTGTASENAELKDTLRLMLSYGAAAQRHFENNLDRLATDEYVKYEFTDGVLADGSNYGLFKKGEKFTVTATSTTASSPFAVWKDAKGSAVASGAELEMTAEKNSVLTAVPQTMEPTFGSYKYVAIIGVDGAGCFYPDETNTPHIDSIFSNGAVTHTMRVTSPSASSVSWMSCLHGVQPENHGNTENIDVENGEPYPLNSKYPSILRVVKEARPEEDVACIYAWIGINGIVENGVGINKQKMGDAAITEYLSGGYIEENKPALLYVHFNNPDAVGHNIGHLTPEYYASIEQIDEYIGKIYRAYEAAGIAEETLFIVTADHGGINKTHGGLHDTEKYSMFAVAGKNVTNTEIENMYIRDTSAVVLHALGIAQPETYTSRIPNGIFADVKDMPRVEYHDPDSPRYHLPVSTPTRDSEGFIGNFIDKKLAAYLPFDGTTEDLLGHEVKENGKITYEDGYFGRGVQLEDGYLNIKKFNLGAGSYTFSAWVKSATPTNGYSPILTNKAMNTNADGFVWALGRYASVERQDHYFIVNAARNGASATVKKNMPKSYIYGWMHVTLIIDRENGVLRMAYDFGDFETVDLPATLNSGASLDTAFSYLTIGEAPDGNAAYKSGIAIDELMIFEGAFTRSDMASLARYFGISEIHPDKNTPVGAFAEGKAPEVYLGFENNSANSGTANTVVNKYNTLTYAEGKCGQAIFLDSTHYTGVEGLTLGKGSFSVAAWIKPTDLAFDPEYDRKLLPIISNAKNGERETLGFNVLLDIESKKLVATLGNGTEGVLGEVDCGKDFCENEWTHIAVVYNMERASLTVYINFVKALDIPLTAADGTAFPTDSVKDTSYPIRIGNFGKATSSHSLMGYVDEVMIFTRALTFEDILTIFGYYND